MLSLPDGCRQRMPLSSVTLWVARRDTIDDEVEVVEFP